MGLYQIDLDSNDGLDIQDIRPFIILNTIAIADNIASEFILHTEEVKETEIYDAINEYLDDVMEKIFDDTEVILQDNEIDII